MKVQLDQVHMAWPFMDQGDQVDQGDQDDQGDQLDQDDHWPGWENLVEKF